MKCVYPNCKEEGKHKFKIMRDDIVTRSFKKKHNIKGNVVGVCSNNIGYCLNREIKKNHSNYKGYFLKRLDGKYVDGRWIKNAI